MRTSVAFLLTALMLVNACAGNSFKFPQLSEQDVLASRAACDSIVNRAATAGRRIYRESEVEVPAEFIFENRGPKYPRMYELGTGRTLPNREAANVRTVFVVDSTGQPDTTTLQSILPVTESFLQSIATYLPSARYKPARLAGHAVPQCVKQSFVFVPPKS